MHAHPMITPLLPLHSPEEVEAEYPADAAKAYLLVWQNMLGHLKSSQTAEEQIHRYRLGDFTIGVRTLAADDPVTSVLLPELDERRVGVRPFPLGRTAALTEGNMEVQSAAVEFVPQDGRARDVTALIDWLDALRAVSPGRLGTILEELERAGWIAPDTFQQYELTCDGAAQLAATANGSGSRINGVTLARWRAAFEDYLESGDDLDGLLSNCNRIFGTSIKIPVTELESLITGTRTAAEAYTLRDNATVEASQQMAFPVGMDPERLIAANHPLRVKRNTRESNLSAGRAHAWLGLSEAERVGIRLGAELAECTAAEERRQLMESVTFDVRFRWLIGLGVEHFPPSREDAVRAHRAWLAGKAETM